MQFIRKMILKTWIVFTLGFSFSSIAWASPWEEGVPIPPGGRSNPMEVPEAELPAAIARGRELALKYPVETSESVFPGRMLRDAWSRPVWDPLEWLISRFFGAAPVTSPSGFYQWLGLAPYGSTPERGTYPDDSMGVTWIEQSFTGKGKALGFTLGCASCHATELFGRSILGMTARFPRANEIFKLGKESVSRISPSVFETMTRASPAEMEIFRRLHAAAHSIGVRKPATLGLDTSLAQVALSMARREQDPDATRSERAARNPRPDLLDEHVADSKPAVWWNLKYKNRWLSDGSVVSGNPIFTNFLWNEIGRGADLVRLSGWLERNASRVSDLTTAVFATEAPRWTDFEKLPRIEIARAIQGEKIFISRCTGCHGTYEKDWSRSTATLRVLYPEQTRVVDVGTDPGRAQGMRSLAEHLNPLRISKDEGMLIRPSQGYVPPPLVGIWARWPYFHNNSAPSLCAVLTSPARRPASYWAGPPRNPKTDFDAECVGYPRTPPAEWKRNRDFLYDSRRPGLGNSGHDMGTDLSPEQKGELIEFLKTL